MNPPDYSLWLLPAPGPARDLLRHYVMALRTAVPGAAPLDPHLTLVPSLGFDRRRAIARARRVAVAIAGGRVPVRRCATVAGVATGAHRYQSIMAGIACEPWLKALNRFAVQTDPSPSRAYYPHISLLYADLDATRIVELAGGLGPLLRRVPLGHLVVSRVCTDIERRHCIWSWPLPSPGHPMSPIP